MRFNARAVLINNLHVLSHKIPFGHHCLNAVHVLKFGHLMLDIWNLMFLGF